MSFRLFNPGCIQRENRWTIRKWLLVIFFLALIVFLILAFVHQSFYYCSGPFGDSNHVDLSWHTNYDKFMKGKCTEGHNNGVKINKLSFIARLILKKTETKREAICAGTLIADDIVITAAHCVNNINLADLEVNIGNPPNIEIFTNFEKKDIKIHKKYHNEKYSNDIALIKLNRTVDPSSTTSTLCIPFDEKNIRKNLTMGEWNTKDIDLNYPRILETTVNGINNVECGQELYNLVEVVQRSRSSQISNEAIEIKGTKEVNYEQFCAGNETVKQGNSGMPVYGNDLITGAPTIFGFVSFGVKEGFGSNVPTVFTKIYDYRHWILCNAY
ncbi:trypsin beta-like [Chironomus tepperi]|uniref:trypsin beta-like n=1 Tax=Chironomus tepperi TaxID=113505 RepID=UPI00391F2ED7